MIDCCWGVSLSSATKRLGSSSSFSPWLDPWSVVCSAISSLETKEMRLKFSPSIYKFIKPHYLRFSPLLGQVFPAIRKLRSLEHDMLLAVATTTLAMPLFLSKGYSPGLLKRNVKIETMFPQQKSALSRIWACLLPWWLCLWFQSTNIFPKMCLVFAKHEVRKRWSRRLRIKRHV